MFTSEHIFSLEVYIYHDNQNICLLFYLLGAKPNVQTIIRVNKC